MKLFKIRSGVHDCKRKLTWSDLHNALPHLLQLSRDWMHSAGVAWMGFVTARSYFVDYSLLFLGKCSGIFCSTTSLSISKGVTLNLLRIGIPPFHKHNLRSRCSQSAFSQSVFKPEIFHDESVKSTQRSPDQFRHLGNTKQSGFLKQIALEFYEWLDCWWITQIHSYLISNRNRIRKSHSHCRKSRK